MTEADFHWRAELLSPLNSLAARSAAWYLSNEGSTAMGAAIEVRRFENPDDALDMKEAGGISIIRMADGTTGMRATFEPGWTWEKDEKPLLGFPPACPMHHTGYCIAGNLVVRMVETGRETRIAAGDFFDIPPGHDGYVDGSERVELILFAPPE